MQNIDINDVSLKMVTAFQTVFKKKWPDIKEFAESEAKKFATNMAEIETWKMNNKITENQAKALSRLHQRSMKMVFTALKGISLTLAEDAINAALNVIRTTINTAIGWSII